LSAELSDAEHVHVHAGGVDGWFPRYHDAFGAVKGKLVWQYPTTDEPELVAVWPGDGVYAASWGYDATGALVCLAIEIEGMQ
jgi:outer membrane protein assembly factor BamB